jgi:hypothetical protein
MAEWDAHGSYNPRLIASQVADLLRSLSKADAAIPDTHASATLYGPITFGALAAFFDAASSGTTAAIATIKGECSPTEATIWRQWLRTLTDEAEARAALVAGRALPANDSYLLAAVTNGAPAQHKQPKQLPSGSEPGYQKMRQEQQRQEGEQSAREQLEAAHLAQQKAELSAAKEQARADSALQQVASLYQEIALLRQELSDSVRQKQVFQDDACNLEAQLEQAALLAEFIRPDNLLSPPEIRLAFQCWCDLTDKGQRNPAAPGGRGVHGLVEAWVKELGLQINKDQLSRLKAMVNWNKQRGAIATQ